jgi:hypothetical protein
MGCEIGRGVGDRREVVEGVGDTGRADLWGGL